MAYKYTRKEIFIWMNQTLSDGEVFRRSLKNFLLAKRSKKKDKFTKFRHGEQVLEEIQKELDKTICKGEHSYFMGKGKCIVCGLPVEKTEAKEDNRECKHVFERSIPESALEECSKCHAYRIKSEYKEEKPELPSKYTGSFWDGDGATQSRINKIIDYISYLDKRLERLESR